MAVFVDGCFWHGCPEHGTELLFNTDYWGPKLQRNRARDQETERHLQAFGWVVVRVWEHESSSEAFDRILNQIRI
jgi:DNA mismatch endonuclease (patch repair protein)